MLTIGMMYQVYDMVIANAEPTEEFDALTIGMVCVRNLQVCMIHDNDDDNDYHKCPSI